MLDNASRIGAHHFRLGKIAAETHEETDLTLCRLSWSTDLLYRCSIDPRLVAHSRPTETGSRADCYGCDSCCPLPAHKFECRRAQLGRIPDDQPCRCLPADVRPVRDRATLQVSCLICGVRRAGWYLPSCARRPPAHCCGPGSLKLLPCRGSPFVDLVISLLQISEGAKGRWRGRHLALRVEGASSE